MTCKKCKANPVWTFTNQTQLCKTCFIDYIEKKVWKTIRQHNMISGREIGLKKENSLNYTVLKVIAEKKFPVKAGNLTSENLSQIAENYFKEMLKGKFKAPNPSNKPLSQVSDAELELYAKLKKLKGNPREKDKKVQSLLSRFMQKNPDLEINIVKAAEQLKY